MPVLTPSTHQIAFGEKSAHGFVPGIGYVRLGPLPIPHDPLGQPRDCEPAKDAPPQSMHILLAPHGEEVKNMRWYPETREWAPDVPMRAHRLAFTSRYLAAYGWKYGRRQ
jgi:hypothetical protein